MLIKEKIFDASTGEETIIEVEESATDKANRLKSEQRIAEAEATAVAKEALLDRLGITADEAKLLLG